MPTGDTKKTNKKPVKKPVKKITPNNEIIKQTGTSTSTVNDIVTPIDNVVELNNAEQVDNSEVRTNWMFILALVLLGVIAAILLINFGYIAPGKSNLSKIEIDNNMSKINSSKPTNGARPEETKDTTVSDGTVKSGDTIKVDYVGKLEDGTIFDSSIEEFAKKAPDYKADSGRKYEPLEFSVGGGQMIKGFDTGVVGMKVGEKKTLTIKPADGYGEATISQEVPKKYLQDNIEQEVPEASFRDYITQTVPKEALGEKGKNLKVGETLESDGMTGEVAEITSTGVTIKIENKQNPFFGKKLVVGAKVDYQGNTITVKKIGKDMITVNILNKQSPFFGKKLIVGLEGKLPNGDSAKIEKIGDENVTVSTKNPQKLAGKTLIFDVELKEIVK